MSERLTSAEVAALLGVARPTVRSWKFKGVGPKYQKYGHAVMYELADVKAWQREQKQREQKKSA